MKRSCILVYLIFIFSTLEARAGGFSNLDFGVRRMGMLTVVARPDDGSAIFHNPAGLTLNSGSRFYTHQGLFMVSPKLKFYDSQGVLRPDHDVGPEWSVGLGPFFSFTTDFGSRDWRLGVALFAPNAFGAALPAHEPSRYHIVRGFFVAGRLTTALAYQANKQFSVGASFSLIYAYYKAKKIVNPMVVIDPDNRFADVATSQASDIELDMNGDDVSWAMDVGVLFRPHPSFRLGVIFASGSSIDLKGTVKLSYYSGVKEEAKHETGLPIPMTLRFGLNWEFAPKFELGFDIGYWHYQVFKEQRTVLSKPIMGMKEMLDIKNYTNAWIWSVGLLYHVHPRVEVMLGFQMDFTAIPEATFTLEIPTRDSKTLSVGIRWQVSRRVRLGAAYMRTWNDAIDIQESTTAPPTNVKGGGDSNFFGIDFEYLL